MNQQNSCNSECGEIVIFKIFLLSIGDEKTTGQKGVGQIGGRIF
jgi:hypothetical protein